jgi:hypothetical protein
MLTRRRYDVDRLVAAANMFDILPRDVFSSVPELSPEVLAAKDAARTLFLDLPECDERTSILNALGRLGTLNLKQKVDARIAVIRAQCPLLFEPLNIFARLSISAKSAINCRNFLVHGTEGDFDYEEHASLMWFFVDTLLFIFGISDLIDAGWSWDAWGQRGSSGHHPFESYMARCEDNMKLLDRVLTEAKEQKAANKRSTK